MNNQVVNFVKNQKLLFWRVISGTNNNMLLGAFPIDDTENPNINESVNELEKLLEILPNGAYLLKGRNKKTNTNSEVSFPFVLNQDAGQFETANGQNPEVFSYINDLTKNFNAQMLQIQTESLKREFEAKLKEIESKYKGEIEKLKLTQDKPDTIDKLINLAPLLLPFFAPKMPQVQNPANIFETLLQAQKTQENLEKNQNIELENLKNLFGENYTKVMMSLDALALKSPAYVNQLANNLLILETIEPENENSK